MGVRKAKRTQRKHKDGSKENIPSNNSGFNLALTPLFIQLQASGT